MTCYGAKDLAAAFRTVRGNTMTIAEEIPEEKYSFRPAPGCRSVAETLTHIALTPRGPEHLQFELRIKSLANFNFLTLREKLAAEEQVARSKSEILELLRTEGEKFAQMLEGASEEFLDERVQFREGMVPPNKSRFEMLMAVKEHEMHHRGQLMLVERMLGITPHLTRQMEERIAAMKAAQAAG